MVLCLKFSFLDYVFHIKDKCIVGGWVYDEISRIVNKTDIEGCCDIYGFEKW